MSTTRILHVVSSMNRAGIENALMNYYRYIDRQKIQFDFLMSKMEPSDFDEEIESLGGRIYRIPMSNPIKYLKGLYNFFKTHKEYQIVHVHHLPWGALALTAAKANGVKNRISHVHFAKDTSKLIGLKQMMREIAKRFSTYYFACGVIAGKNYFGAKRLEKPNFKVLNNAIDGAKFNFNTSIREKIRRELNIGDDTLVVGFVARLRPVKNPIFTLDVFKALSKKLPDVRLIMVGDGFMKPELEEYARQTGVAEKCIFTGAVDNPQDYMQAMDILLFPSINEGLGMVAVEAQATGLRCIASTGVPTECKLTELVTFLPVADGCEKWAEEILNGKDYQREGRIPEIRKAGYEAATTAGELQRFYLDLPVE